MHLIIESEHSVFSTIQSEQRQYFSHETRDFQCWKFRGHGLL